MIKKRKNMIEYLEADFTGSPIDDSDTDNLAVTE